MVGYNGMYVATETSTNDSFLTSSQNYDKLKN